MFNKKLIGGAIVLIAAATLTGCNKEESEEARDCQSSVYGLLQSDSFTEVMSDDITIKDTDTAATQMKLSADICRAKNPMYFK